MTAERDLRIMLTGVDLQAAVSLQMALERTATEVRALGANSLEHTVVDESGSDWDEKFWNPQTRAVKMLRFRAIAVFPDGHTVEGDSDEFKATQRIYAADPRLQIQACERLLAKWSLT